MNEQFIWEYIPHRMQQLGYSKWLVRHRDLGLQAFTKLRFSAYNELFFVVGDPKGVEVESNYGLYTEGDSFLDENIHEHRGEILIQNTTDEPKRIKMVQVIIVN